MPIAEAGASPVCHRPPKVAISMQPSEVISGISIRAHQQRQGAANGAGVMLDGEQRRAPAGARPIQLRITGCYHRRIYEHHATLRGDTFPPFCSRRCATPPAGSPLKSQIRKSQIPLGRALTPHSFNRLPNQSLTIKQRPPDQLQKFNIFIIGGVNGCHSPFAMLLSI